MTLTEQWKKGELEVGEYYLRYKDGTIDREYYDYANVYDLMVEKGFSTESCDISEVLAPVPSYEEWQYLLLDNKILKQCQEIDFGTAYTETVKTKAENQQLKELLYSLKYCLTSENIEPQIRVEKSLAKIEEFLTDGK